MKCNTNAGHIIFKIDGNQLHFRLFLSLLARKEISAMDSAVNEPDNKQVVNNNNNYCQLF